MIHLFDAWERVSASLRQAERLLVMLDFDGTLAPIVPRPPDARIPPTTLAVLRGLQECPDVVLAIVSGRAARDVQALAGVAGIHYFGSHGRERLRPEGDAVATTGGGREEIRKFCQILVRQLTGVRGFELENKGVAAAVHYRHVDGRLRNRVETAVRKTARSVGSLSVGVGKLVFDVTPVDGVDKGVAATELQREVGGLPVFFGDDTTDESAFRALATGGLTVYVGPDSAHSAARYRVADPAEVGEALRRILEIARARKRPTVPERIEAISAAGPTD